jgi:hypothetical protein
LSSSFSQKRIEHPQQLPVTFSHLSFYTLFALSHHPITALNNLSKVVTCLDFMRLFTSVDPAVSSEVVAASATMVAWRDGIEDGSLLGFELGFVEGAFRSCGSIV